MITDLTYDRFMMLTLHAFLLPFLLKVGGAFTIDCCPDSVAICASVVYFHPGLTSVGELYHTDAFMIRGLGL